jgi:hypothetical protein
MNPFARPALLAIVCLLLSCSSTLAWTRLLREDAVVVKNSELIVVGRLKPGSIQYVAKPEGRDGSEYHATLIVTEVLKGAVVDKEIPIIIHYGLTPIVGKGPAPKDLIEIFDTGSSAVSFLPVAKDARENLLWLLRRSNGPFGRGTVANKLGVVEPDELQPLLLRDYFAAHVAKEPEKAMKELAGKKGVAAEPAQIYLELQEVRRILNLRGEEAKVESLLPYYVKTSSWWKNRSDQEHHLYHVARQGLASCGKSAGVRLRKLFNDPQHQLLRTDIIKLWGEIGYTDGAEVLIGLLKEHDKFWTQQKLEKGWWHDDSRPEVTEKHKKNYYEGYHAVMALRLIGDRDALDAIRLTRARWETIELNTPERGGPPSLLNACRYVLKELEGKK